MIPLKFYRDDNYVYYNNPNGITKKMSIADFEALMGGECELPTYSSSNSGEVLAVDSDGDLEWKSLPAPSGGLEYVGYLTLQNKNTSDIANGTARDCAINDISELYDKNGNTIVDVPNYDVAFLVGFYAGDQNFNGTFKGYRGSILPEDAPLFQYAPTMRISNSTGNSLTVADGTLFMSYCLYKLG